MSLPLTPSLLLKAYRAGVFPMAETKEDTGFDWIEPVQRGIIPLDDFHLSKRLARTIRSNVYNVHINRNFEAVIDSCAHREETWINGPIRNAFVALHETGHAHSVETYDQDGQLVGGLYGLAIGGAFFGESMFSTARDASKVALAALVDRLKAKGFTLLDTQFITDHLKQFGAVTIPQRDYLSLLDRAVALDVAF